MKKFVSVILVLIISVAMIACNNDSVVETNNATKDDKEYVSSGKQEENRDYFEWSPTDDTHIVGWSEKGLKQTEVVIPAECTLVQGLEGNENVKYISFANPNTEILSTTFKSCINLEKIDLPENLKKLDNSILNGCISLKTILVPDTVTEIGSNVFLDCESLEDVVLGVNIDTVGRKAFCNCVALKSVVLPDSVTIIEKSAFENCTMLEEVTFGIGLTTIGESAFEWCNSLKKVVLPEGVTSLGDWAFAHCETIEEIYLPASLEAVDVSSIVQAHPVKVYVVEGSYMDTKVSELMGVEFYDKQYQ